MAIVNDDELNEFLSKRNYDVRKSGNARWIDQKCTPDVVSIIADCISSFSEETKSLEFTSRDIWYSKYAQENVQGIFKKPATNNSKAKNEYDKFFQQPMELLSYSGVLSKIKKGRENFYSIIDTKILYFISLSEKNALKFLQCYIEKVLKDTGIFSTFKNFFDEPSEANFSSVKSTFTNMTITYTKINHNTETWRIFTKVLNPLSFKYNTYGTERGVLSRNLITYDMLMYNRDNFRDIYSLKPKNVTRKAYLSNRKNSLNKAYVKYESQKSKRFIRAFNDKYRNEKSEIDPFTTTDIATTIHHIFPESNFPQICGYYENLIALTPTQHYNYAHSNFNTQTINIDFQYKCLVVKMQNIFKNLKSNSEEHIYSKERLLKVLDVGLRTNEFEKNNNVTYDGLLELINKYYPNVKNKILPNKTNLAPANDNIC